MQVELIDTLGSDLTVVNAARVSYAKHSKEFDERDERLINYLAKHGHWTPFAHCFLQFRISAPLFVARQLVKHQVGLVWNEVSRRYVSDEPEFDYTSVLRSKPTNSKQGSGEILGDEQQVKALRLMEEVHDVASRNYQQLIEDGVAPEQARSILPQSMMTEWYWSGSLHAFSRVFRQRIDPHSQLETNAVASDIGFHCQEQFPVSWAALTDTQ